MYIYIYLYLSICISKYLSYLSINTYMFINIYVYYIYIYIYIYLSMYISIHIYMYIYIYIHVFMMLWRFTCLWDSSCTYLLARTARLKGHQCVPVEAVGMHSNMRRHFEVHAIAGDNKKTQFTNHSQWGSWTCTSIYRVA